ncbi:MAG: GumC family protein [Thermodesulfobacteriota bacterium]
MLNEANDFGEYLAVLKERKKTFIIPFLAVLIISTLIAFLWPPSFQSSSTILIEEQQIPQEFVRSTVTGFADQRIQSLTQQILSRVKLWEIIQQFNLYPKLREKITREEIIELMRDNIKLETISAEVGDPRKRRSGQPTVTIAFSVAYRGENPAKVQQVSGTLASLYLEQNLKTREAQAQSTTKFLEAELKALQERIKDLGDKITMFKEKYEGLLPEQQMFNRDQAARMEMEIKQIEAYIRSNEERKIYLQGQLATVKTESPIIGITGERIMAPADRQKALEIALADLRSRFSENHPDIQKIRREMAELTRLSGQSGDSVPTRQKMATQLKGELAQLQGKYSDQHPEVKKLKTQIAGLEKTPAASASPQPASTPDNPTYIGLAAQIKAADSEISSLRQQKVVLQDKVKMYRQRLEEAPKVEQQYMALMRDYENAHTKHQEIMNKILEARIAEGMEEHQKAEKFTLIDPASFPETPVSPNRGLIFFAGVVLSFAAGIGSVALAEHMDHSVSTSDALTRLTGLPVLGSIIRIKTREDIIRAHRKRKLIWMVSGVSLIMILVLFHFLYMNIWVLAAKLFRLADRYT